ncbi:MAG: cellobiose phosphorylase [Eubacteriales bacterium]|nr:cellobiose phosphorylase [Eubacteriales bacterium]
MKPLHFIDDFGSFTLQDPETTSYLYLPLASEKGLKSSVTPTLGGDAKIDQETFLLEPVSAENLHNNRAVRNFWIAAEDHTVCSVVGASALQEAARFTPNQDESSLSAGFMWQKLTRKLNALPVRSTVTSFVPEDANAEVMIVELENLSEQELSVTPYAALPIYGRSADNLRDHRNVTSMLHRIRTIPEGVLVKPTMSFDERGHRENHHIYYVTGCDSSGQKPEAFYPTLDDYLGEGGTGLHPRAVLEQLPGVPAGSTAAGKEAMGAFRFSKLSLSPGQTAQYILLLGVEDSEEEILTLFSRFDSFEKASAEFEHTREYWQKKVNVDFHTGRPDFDSLMKWISFQPFLRRLYGCSFLPHHDYGRGGRGWRDLWQDCLSLLLLEPKEVGEMITKNFGGVRIDGTNATIIGDGDGNFIADRNGISRVWMDHALWPLITTTLYIHQTGDLDLLNTQVPYFKDSQTRRGTAVDHSWSQDQGSLLLTEHGEIYQGSVLEHLLIQQLTAVFDVGSHGICRLRGADWNDALDMAAEHGESVAFTCAYAGNLRTLAQLLYQLSDKDPEAKTELSEEVQILLDLDLTSADMTLAKRKILDSYTSRCEHHISGKKRCFILRDLAVMLEKTADQITDLLKHQEWIEGNYQDGWFNSYYDNHGRAVEGFFGDQVRMMLTGQVFAIMGNVADDEQILKIVRSADRYLFRKEIGGYRLNTDFQELKFDMGRMFGFAYGEKENGAVFSHMSVMFANALFRRGFAKEGQKSLDALADAALCFETSRIYPGIPEYFRSDGRGMYHYLTGAASWYLLTMLTEVFGVKGSMGDLVLAPKLTKDLFDQDGTASVTAPFGGRMFHITYLNEKKLDYGSCHIRSVKCDSTLLAVTSPNTVRISKEMIQELSDDVYEILVVLD